MSTAPPATETEARLAHPPAPAWARRFMELWHSAECYIAVTAFGLIALLLLIDVIGREFVGPILHKLGLYSGSTGLFGSQRISVYLLVIGSFAGIGIATATASHLVPRVGFAWVPPAWGPAVDRLADAITGLFLLGAVWYGLEFVSSSKSTGLRAPVLDFSIWPVQLAIPLGFLSASVRYFFYAAWPALRPEPPQFQE
jgi:TRAP-type C4-dicarboxylate transport system permease small subunit